MVDCRGMISETPTAREIEALRLLSEGLNGVQAADRMGISYQTLKNHLANVYPKLGVHRQAHAMAVSMRRGLI